MNIVAVDRRGDRRLDLGRRRPHVAQEDVRAVGALAERLRLEVDVHPAGERVGDDERRRGEVVRLHLGMDARLEVAVAGEHRARDEVAVGDRGRDLVRQRARVADARRAAVADRVEAELVEVALQAGALVVVGDDARAGRERRLHPRAAPQAELDRLLRERGRRAIITCGFEVFVHDVIAAITTAPWSSVNSLAVELDARRGGPRRGASCATGGASALACRPAPARSSGRSPGTSPRARRRRRRRRTCRAPRGTTPSRGRAARGPADGAARRATARPRRGRARRPASTPGATPGSCQSRFSLQYASTSATRSAGRPVSRR